MPFMMASYVLMCRQETTHSLTHVNHICAYVTTSQSAQQAQQRSKFICREVRAVYRGGHTAADLPITSAKEVMFLLLLVCLLVG